MNPSSRKEFSVGAKLLGPRSPNTTQVPHMYHQISHSLQNLGSDRPMLGFEGVGLGSSPSSLRGFGIVAAVSGSWLGVGVDIHPLAGPLRRFRGSGSTDTQLRVQHGEGARQQEGLIPLLSSAKKVCGMQSQRNDGDSEPVQAPLHEATRHDLVSHLQTSQLLELQRQYSASEAKTGPVRGLQDEVSKLHAVNLSGTARTRAAESMRSNKAQHTLGCALKNTATTMHAV